MPVGPITHLPVSPCFQTHEILNKSIIWSQMNKNNLQNAHFFSFRSKFEHLATVHTHTHTHEHLTQLTHFYPSMKWWSTHTILHFYVLPRSVWMWLLLKSEAYSWPVIVFYIPTLLFLETLGVSVFSLSPSVPFLPSRFLFVCTLLIKRAMTFMQTRFCVLIDKVGVKKEQSHIASPQHLQPAAQEEKVFLNKERNKSFLIENS